MTTQCRILCLLLGCVAPGLIVRHDLPDEKFIAFARSYPQLCHLPMGEGTLIDAWWVLTAGHIGRDLNRDVRNGYAPTVRCNGKTYGIAAVMVHPGFQDTERGIEHDVALVQLAAEVPDVAPAALYGGADEAGKHIVLVGAGDVGNGRTGRQKWDKIARAAMNMVDHTDSLWISFSFDPPGSKQVTSLEGISGPDDSGGPAFYERDSVRYVVGVSSHQKSPNGKGLYGAVEYYSRVSVERAWIIRTIGP